MYRYVVILALAKVKKLPIIAAWFRANKSDSCLSTLCIAKIALSNHGHQFSSTRLINGQFLHCQSFESPSHKIAEGSSSPKYPPHPQAYTERRPIAHLRNLPSDHSLWPAYLLLQQHPHKSSRLLLNPPSKQRRVTFATTLPWQENRTL